MGWCSTRSSKRFGWVAGWPTQINQGNTVRRFFGIFFSFPGSVIGSYYIKELEESQSIAKKGKNCRATRSREVTNICDGWWEGGGGVVVEIRALNLGRFLWILFVLLEEDYLHEEVSRILFDSRIY